MALGLSRRPEFLLFCYSVWCIFVPMQVLKVFLSSKAQALAQGLFLKEGGEKVLPNQEYGGQIRARLTETYSQMPVD